MKIKSNMFFKKIPLLFPIIQIMLNFFSKISFPGSEKYWETRYSRGGNSGPGSHGRLAEFKAEIINSFVENNMINSVIDFGCGDGHQLSLFNFPNYVGLDVSKTAIKLCIRRFKEDKTKSFFLYDPECFDDKSSIFKADLSLSLDVIYHLIEDHIFGCYMKHLFSAANKYVIIYSSDINVDQSYKAPHVKQRQFSKWIETNLSEWKLIKKIKNKYPNESCADFFIYKKVNK